MSEKKYVIIAAGGYGTRMQSEVPKQFLLLGGVPVIVHAIQIFNKIWDDAQFIVVLPEDQLVRWEKINKKFLRKKNIRATCGGATRFHSVRNGLKFVKDEGIIAVQDACRPLTSEQLLTKCLDEVIEKKVVIPVIDLKDSIREILKDGSRNRNRAKYKAVQTPQCFYASILKNAYRQTFVESFTDDASVVEAAGYRVHMVEGEPDNFKITTPYDMMLAEIILHKQQTAS